MKFLSSTAFTVFLLFSVAHTGFSFPSLPSIPDIPIDIPTLSDLPFIGDILEEEPAITSSLDDAVTEVPHMDGFEPESFTSLDKMPVNSEGMIYLVPGAYELETRSYCLHAGTHVSDTRGNGYIYAPLEGDRQEIIQAILDRSSDHAEIPQSQVQALIWAVLAKCDFDNMNNQMQTVANELLNSDEIFELNGGYMGLIPDDMINEYFGDLPEPLRAVLEAEAELRNAFSQAGSSYEDLEEIAILSGNPPAEYNVRDIPEGRWSLHPAGYYIRYFPTGYQHTRVEIWVPEFETTNLSYATSPTKAPKNGSRKDMLSDAWDAAQGIGEAIGAWFDPPNGIAMPGNTCRQRLLIAPELPNSQDPESGPGLEDQSEPGVQEPDQDPEDLPESRVRDPEDLPESRVRDPEDLPESRVRDPEGQSNPQEEPGPISEDEPEPPVPEPRPEDRAEPPSSRGTHIIEQDFELGDTGVFITMVWIEPGDYMMGAQTNEVGARNHEYPRHLETISEGFWIGKYEVTQEQWEAVVPNWTFYFDNNPNRPAESISWDYIQSNFLNSINSSEPGDWNPWRLPSESEWEYVNRAGHDETRFWWGDDLNYRMIDNYAWYSDNDDTGDGHETHDVGLKLPNPWGLYDMNGNVLEWCEDYFYGNYDAASDEGINRISRGGSWGESGVFCRSAYRSHYDPTNGYNNIGFRLVRERRSR